MNGSRSFPSLDGLAFGLLSSVLALFAVGVLLIPQRIAQRPAQLGVVAIHLAADGGLRLWNRPISAQQLPQVLQQAARLNSGARVRLIPSSSTSWGVVQQFLPLLERGALPFEVQLPVASNRP